MSVWDHSSDPHASATPADVTTTPATSRAGRRLDDARGGILIHPSTGAASRARWVGTTMDARDMNRRVVRDGAERDATRRRASVGRETAPRHRARRGVNARSSARGTGARGRRAIVAMMMMMARARAGAEAFGIARVDSTNRAFVDGLTARRLTARGANAYSLRYDWLGNAKEKEKAEKTMDDAIALGIDVIRTWAFMDGDES